MVKLRSPYGPRYHLGHSVRHRYSVAVDLAKCTVVVLLAGVMARHWPRNRARFPPRSWWCWRSWQPHSEQSRLFLAVLPLGWPDFGTTLGDPTQRIDTAVSTAFSARALDNETSSSHCCYSLAQRDSVAVVGVVAASKREQEETRPMCSRPCRISPVALPGVCWREGSRYCCPEAVAARLARRRWHAARPLLWADPDRSAMAFGRGGSGLLSFRYGAVADPAEPPM